MPIRDSKLVHGARLLFSARLGRTAKEAVRRALIAKGTRYAYKLGEN